MNKVYICYIAEDLKNHYEGTILGVYEDETMAYEMRNKFDEENPFMAASVVEKRLIKKVDK
ncbi:TPA: hypothetical protein ACF2DE_002826 [Clostridium perfringens]